ncbi:hypothetical protein FHS43_002408 [Streptosporangium becharense]|uniref:DUF4184 domain-containing protein n=1 Tax=Streptosporangium becharense TaxID=1816182 RepID=A0A7W9IKL4_9ACTN|nr:DUF4184 family protein [Streptosporangium becharense]MBB2911143.1 hypothetical protein [Streptosporangium becharense]MBB5821799.1 hypothetical protein [Streptosporangium becharense]
MPFTPSHVAAVLPLISSRRIRAVLDPWALALGAMVPDLPIFFPFLPDYRVWHSLRGVLTIDPLAVVVLLAVFHLVLRDPLTALLPPSLAGRAAAVSPGMYGLRRLPAVVAGGVVGALTHKVWDSFTHSYSSAMWGWPWLDTRVAGVVSLFRLLQYVSTVAGLVIVVWWVLRGLSRMEARELPERLALPAGERAAVLIATVVSVLLGAVAWPMAFPAQTAAQLVTRVGAGVFVGCCALLFGYALIWQLRRAMAVFEGA